MACHMVRRAQIDKPFVVRPTSVGGRRFCVVIYHEQSSQVMVQELTARSIVVGNTLCFGIICLDVAWLATNSAFEFIFGCSLFGFSSFASRSGVHILCAEEDQN